MQLDEAPASLGSTLAEIYRAWEKSGGVGFIAGGGGTYDWRGGKLHRVFSPTKTALATYRPATNAETADVEEAVQRGWLQIELRPPSGVSFRHAREYGERNRSMTTILHQATGNPLPADESVDVMALIGAAGSLLVGGGLGAGAVKAVRAIQGLLKVGKKSEAEKTLERLQDKDRAQIERYLKAQQRMVMREDDVLGERITRDDIHKRAYAWATKKHLRHGGRRGEIYWRYRRRARAHPKLRRIAESIDWSTPIPTVRHDLAWLLRNDRDALIEHAEAVLSEAEGPKGAKLHKGIYYWARQQDAIGWAKENGWPTDRIVSYERGFAVQAGKSGNYAGPGETPRAWRGTSAVADEAFSKEKVKVYAADRKTVITEVSPQVTSIGASKAAEVRAVSMERVDGKYAWVVKESVDEMVFDAIAALDEGPLSSALAKIVQALKAALHSDNMDRAHELWNRAVEHDRQELFSALRAQGLLGERVDEVSPPGFEGTVRAMKRHGDIDNPWALSWWMKKRGAKSHYKKDGTAKDEARGGVEEAVEPFPAQPVSRLSPGRAAAIENGLRSSDQQERSCGTCVHAEHDMRIAPWGLVRCRMFDFTPRTGEVCDEWGDVTVRPGVLPHATLHANASTGQSTDDESVEEGSDPLDRFNDLQKQGFMRGRKAGKSRVEPPIIACDDCLNWHRKGKHTATPEQRKENRASHRREQAEREQRRPKPGADGMLRLPTSESIDEGQTFTRAGSRVDGLVVRKDVPNTSSIEASVGRYEVLPGIREVPFSAFPRMGTLHYYSVSEERRTKGLAEKIKESGEISPLIVVMDREGPYVLEGGHRFDALRELGHRSFPALVVQDLDSIGEAAAIEEGTEVANEILRQLGGPRFTAMTGAKNFVGAPHSLSFRVGRNDKGVRTVRISLNASNTYDMEFLGRDLSVKAYLEDIYAEDLRSAFTRETGLETSLGTMRGESVDEAVRLSVTREPDTDEWVVRWVENGRFNPDKSYYTDDKADAVATMAEMQRQLDASTKGDALDFEAFEQMGREAHAAGGKAVPMLDRKLMDELRRLTKGSAVGFSSKILDAWAKGWHAANLKGDRTESCRGTGKRLTEDAVPTMAQIDKAPTIARGTAGIPTRYVVIDGTVWSLGARHPQNTVNRGPLDKFKADVAAGKLKARLDEVVDPLAAIRTFLIQHPGRYYTLSQLADASGMPDADVLKAASRLVTQGTAQFSRGEGYSLAGDSRALRLPGGAKAPPLRFVGPRGTRIGFSEDSDPDFAVVRGAKGALEYWTGKRWSQDKGDAKVYDTQEQSDADVEELSAQSETTTSAGVSGFRSFPLGKRPCPSANVGSIEDVYAPGACDDEDEDFDEREMDDYGQMARDLIAAVGHAKGVQAKFLASKDMSMDDARALSKAAQAKLQAEYTAWLKQRKDEALDEGQLSVYMKRGDRFNLIEQLPDSPKGRKQAIGQLHSDEAAPRKTALKFQSATLPGVTGTMMVAFSGAGPDDSQVAIVRMAESMGVGDTVIEVVKRGSKWFVVPPDGTAEGQFPDRESAVTFATALARRENYAVVVTMNEARQLNEKLTDFQINVAWEGDQYVVEFPELRGPAGSNYQNEYRFPNLDAALAFARPEAARQNFVIVVWNVKAEDATVPTGLVDIGGRVASSSGVIPAPHPGQVISIPESKLETFVLAAQALNMPASTPVQYAAGHYTLTLPGETAAKVRELVGSI